MIIEKRISFLRLISVIWRELLAILVVSSVPVICLIHFDLGEYAINASIPLVIGTAIAIFLGFRTNSAYERWWEARKVWGGIINDSRNLVRLSDNLFGSLSQEPDDADRQAVREIAYRQIAWTKLLDCTLKDLPAPEEAIALLGEQDRITAQTASDPLLRLLAAHGDTVRTQQRHERIDTRQVVLIQETLSQIANHYGACQRIKNTVFPTHYSFFTRVFIWIFIFLLACSLPSHENANHYTLIPAIFLIGWVFFMVEGIGSYMQDPFVNNRNVIPMSALSRVIERDLLEAIGETEIPQPVQPVDGALY